MKSHYSSLLVTNCYLGEEERREKHEKVKVAPVQPENNIIIRAMEPDAERYPALAIHKKERED